MMPRTYVLVRHGESEGNVAVNASKKGDNSFYTDRYVTTPGKQWMLTPKGVKQAQVIGEWLRSNLPVIDRYYVSPYVRTRMTAANLGLPYAQWRINRSYREREWGEIDTLPRSEFKTTYPNSARIKKINPLYWAPPGGESIADVSENRVRNILDTLHRECSDQVVLAVTHGENMTAHRLMLERWSDDVFALMDQDRDERIENCGVLFYTRSEDSPGPLDTLVTAAPVQSEDGAWSVKVTPPLRFNASTLSNSDLEEQFKELTPLFDH